MGLVIAWRFTAVLVFDFNSIVHGEQGWRWRYMSKWKCLPKFGGWKAYIYIYIYNIDYLKWCWFIESTPRTGCLIEQPLLGHSGRLYFFIQNLRFASKLSETDLRAGMDCEDECYSSSAVILPCTYWMLMKSLKKCTLKACRSHLVWGGYYTAIGLEL